MLSIDISKHQQSSDWGAIKLTTAQINYAASDVLYLHRLMEKLDVNLQREGRTEIAKACFDFCQPAQHLIWLAGQIMIFFSLVMHKYFKLYSKIIKCAKYIFPIIAIGLFISIFAFGKRMPLDQELLLQTLK